MRELAMARLKWEALRRPILSGFPPYLPDHLQTSMLCNSFHIYAACFSSSKMLNLLIVISKFLERHAKARLSAPAYLRALRRIKGVARRAVHVKIRSDFQRVRGG